MTDQPVDVPQTVQKAQEISDRYRFYMASEPRTGALLRTLAASKPGGRILEIGSGLGLGAAWLLAGMDEDARLTTLETHPKFAAVCRETLAPDSRVEVVTTDAIDWLENYSGPPFDLVFMDTTTAKFFRRDLVFQHLAKGALVVADDLLPQPKWNSEHAGKVERFRREFVKEPELVPLLMDWASGIALAAYRGRG
jgi:predicted O-methyltransferase YrrM